MSNELKPCSIDLSKLKKGVLYIFDFDGFQKIGYYGYAPEEDNMAGHCIIEEVDKPWKYKWIPFELSALKSVKEYYKSQEEEYKNALKRFVDWAKSQGCELPDDEIINEITTKINNKD